MSLTSHLDDPRSPVRRYVADKFGHVRNLRFADTDAPTSHIDLDGERMPLVELERFAPGPARVMPSDRDGYPWATSGTAWDYRLRYLFEVANPAAFVASTGAQMLHRSAHRGPPAIAGIRGELGRGWTELAAALGELTERVSPVGRALEPPDERRLSQLCGALALYEQLFRMGRAGPGWERSPLVQAGPDIDLPALLGLVDPRLTDDLAAMTGLFVTERPTLLTARPVTANPTVARSGDLGGADADLIVDRLLLEVKVTANASLSQLVVWQVLGYLLADTDDTHRIRHVGFYFPRQGTLWTFGVPEFLRRLAGEQDVDLVVARLEFATACLRREATSAAPRAVVDTHARLARGEAVGDGQHVQREVRFHPSVRRTGAWHLPVEQVPWVASTRLSGADLTLPACGAGVALDMTAAPHVLPVGQQRRDADRRLCRHCWTYTEAFYGMPFDRDEVPPLADLPYYPPTSRRTSRWHARAGDTGYVVTGSADGPACSIPADLDLTAEPLRVPASGLLADADPRMCRRCLAVPPRPAAPGS